MNAAEPMRPLIEIERDVKALTQAKADLLNYAGAVSELPKIWKFEESLQVEIERLQDEKCFRHYGMKGLDQ